MSFISKSKNSLIAAGLVASSLFMSSCLDDMDTQELPPAAYVSIYQGASEAPAMTVYADQNQVNNQPLGYTQTLAYSPYYTGNRNFRFAAYNSATSLLEKSFELKADSVYSIFVATAAEGIDAIIAEDVWKEPNAEISQLRFVHLSPDSESVYLEVSDAESPVVTASTFKSVSSFQELTPGNVTLTVRSSETDEILIQSGTLELKGNRVYTLILRGLKSETSGDKKLDIQLLTNFTNY